MELTRQTLHDLSKLQTNSHPILSAYLNVDPATGNLVSYPVVFRDRVRALAATLQDEAERAALEREAQRVLRFLEHDFVRTGKGLAIFSAEPAGLWEVQQLLAPVPNLVYLNREPVLGPLVRVAEDLERTAVLLVDKEHARLYTLRLGEIEDQSAIFDEVPGKHSQGSWSRGMSFPAMSQGGLAQPGSHGLGGGSRGGVEYDRHIEYHVREHMKHALSRLDLFARGRPFGRLILGGPQEALADFRQVLPPQLAQRVIGTLTLSLEAPAEEVRLAALEMARRWEQEDEERRVRELLEGAALGGRAVVGWTPTLQALQFGKVWRLLVAEGFAAPCFECPQCGYLSATEGACPACDRPLTEVQDGVSHAIVLALRQDGDIEVVAEHAAAVLRDHGGIGAIVRF
ncbi:MAG: hypothetical protein HY689_06510 [Chloroflexi bacterium]|nr:hypothetical protein [Chloroflexota bacterium]